MGVQRGGGAEVLLPLRAVRGALTLTVPLSTAHPGCGLSPCSPRHRSAAIHAEAPEFVEMSVEQEILVTGIKVVDLLAPYAKGGKIGTFGCLEQGSVVVEGEWGSFCRAGPGSSSRVLWGLTPGSGFRPGGTSCLIPPLMSILLTFVLLSLLKSLLKN